mgnify:CR=1 FL=1|jgi:hypothetical protein|tara:strand:+ start:1186 stop:1374 length:189 start_codon:yes stop_codon:yes gene_type:complete
MKWLPVEQYAKKRGISRQYAYLLIKLGKVKSRKVEKKVEVLEIMDDITKQGLINNTAKGKRK